MFYLLRNLFTPSNNLIPKSKDIIQLPVHVLDRSNIGINPLLLPIKKINGSSKLWKKENHLYWILCHRDIKSIADCFRIGKLIDLIVIFLTDESFHHHNHYGSFLFIIIDFIYLQC